MSLKQLKLEILELPEIKSDMDGFKKFWVKPIEKGQKRKAHIVQKQLHGLHKEDKSTIHNSLNDFYTHFSSLEHHGEFNQKLQGLNRAMIEMKLLSLRGAEDSSKMKFLQSTLLEDPHFSLSSTIKQLKHFDSKLKQVETMYHDINGYLHQTLSLEHSVALMELPHYAYLQNLKETAKSQKRIVKKLGREFVSMQRKLQNQKKKQHRGSD